MSDFIYLASQSPRRKQLLEQWGVRCELLLPDADEDVEALEDGRYNIVLEGLQRFTIVRELDASTAFRQVEAELWDEKESGDLLSLGERAALEQEARRFADAQAVKERLRADISEAVWRSADAGFALSDHADWPGLLSAIKSTEAEKVYLTHGSTASFGRFLQEEKGIDAVELQTLFGVEEVE